jgi:hypothetical protein
MCLSPAKPGYLADKIYLDRRADRVNRFLKGGKQEPGGVGNVAHWWGTFSLKTDFLADLEQSQENVQLTRINSGG